MGIDRGPLISAHQYGELFVDAAAVPPRHHPEFDVGEPHKVMSLMNDSHFALHVGGPTLRNPSLLVVRLGETEEVEIRLEVVEVRREVREQMT